MHGEEIRDCEQDLGLSNKHEEVVDPFVVDLEDVDEEADRLDEDEEAPQDEGDHLGGYQDEDKSEGADAEVVDEVEGAEEASAGVEAFYEGEEAVGGGGELVGGGADSFYGDGDDGEDGDEVEEEDEAGEGDHGEEGGEGEEGAFEVGVGVGAEDEVDLDDEGHPKLEEVFDQVTEGEGDEGEVEEFWGDGGQFLEFGKAF